MPGSRPLASVAPAKMRWILKCPAPTNRKRHLRWGDFHFAHSLKSALERQGDEVTIQLHGEWLDETQTADAVLVLRGRHPYERQEVTRNAVHVVWNISHPDDVPFEEYATYDIVCVASEQHARAVRREVRRPVFPLLQCTDPEVFHEPPEGTARRGVVFVGNTRSVRRDLVLWAVELGLPVQIWGGGWPDFIDESHIVAERISNEKVGALYARSRVTLNDHWPDMRAHGFINNRIFDAMAAGVVVISDRHPALEALFPEEVLYAGSKEELAEAVERVTLSYPTQLERVRAVRPRIVEEFSFDARAKKLRFLVELERSGRSSRRAPVPNVETIAALSKVVDKYCPVCQQDAKSFLPGGVKRRPGARCPTCGALERHRLIWLYLGARTDLFDGRRKRLLHVAPEPHFASRLWNRDDIEYLSVDLHPVQAMERMDLTRIQEPDESFDVVLCNDVLEHIPDDAAAMRELVRILKPGGWAILQVPIKGDETFEDPTVTDPRERARLFGQSDHVRFYGRDFRDRLEAAGFEVTVDSFATELPRSMRKLCGLSNQDIYFCRRPAAR